MRRSPEARRKFSPRRDDVPLVPRSLRQIRVGQGRPLVSVLLAALTALAVAAHPARAAATPVSAMNGWSLHGLSSSDLSAQLTLMQSEGVSELRVDASWSTIEPNAPGAGGPAFSWGSEDAEVAALAAHSIRWLPILDYSAPWAASTTGDWRSPPADDAQYAAFAAAVASRYGPGGTFWALNPQLPYEPVTTYEVWNEENATYFWDTGPDPAGYARLYLAARSAIHAAQPQATVMTGGLTNPQQGISALQFLHDMFTAVPSLAGNLDAVGVHPYAANAAGVVSFVVQVRDLLDAYGAGAAPIDVTEFGWQTGSAAVEQQRAAMMSAVATSLGNSNCGIGLLAPYDWEDPSYITTGDWGLAGSGGIRPAGAAWISGLVTAANSAPAALCPPPVISGGSGPTAGTGNAPTTSGTGSTGASTPARTATTPVRATTPAKNPPRAKTTSRANAGARAKAKRRRLTAHAASVRRGRRVVRHRGHARRRTALRHRV